MSLSEEQATQLIKKAAELGRIKAAPGKEEAFASINLKEPYFTITKVDGFYFWTGKEGERIIGGFQLDWETASAGFGTASFYQKRDGKLYCENECMGREFLLSVFKKMLEDCVLESESEAK